MTDTQAGLLPCPFCGDENVVFRHERMESSHAGFISCRGCDANGPNTTTWRKTKEDAEAEAVARWNAVPRPSPPASAEVVERVARMVSEHFRGAVGFTHQEDLDRVAFILQASGAVPAVPEMRTHAFVPHPKHPQFCNQCGYPEHERLQHTMLAARPKG